MYPSPGFALADILPHFDKEGSVFFGEKSASVTLVM